MNEIDSNFEKIIREAIEYGDGPSEATFKAIHFAAERSAIKPSLIRRILSLTTVISAVGAAASLLLFVNIHAHDRVESDSTAIPETSYASAESVLAILFIANELQSSEDDISGKKSVEDVSPDDFGSFSESLLAWQELPCGLGVGY